MKNRRLTWLMCWSTASVIASGCDYLSIGLDNDCEFLLTCGHFPGGDAGGTPEGCIPSELTSVVSDTCGVFVSTGGDDEGAGTKAAPLKTLSVAISRAAEQGSAVYACAEEFKEAAEVPAGVKFFGGLDCANGWTWVGEEKKTTVAPGKEGIALKVLRGDALVRIEDVSVHAADAEASGTSSIAVLVDGATADFTRCELVAGNGADGAEGEDAPSEVPAQASPGNAGTDACSDLDTSGAPDATLLGGAQVENACGGALSIGGDGGAGRVNNGGDGATSQSTAETARGGVGETVAGAWDCGGAEPNGRGDDGSNGSSGEAGVAASGLGALSSSGYTGVSGGSGKAGTPGQGGGGGGGAKGGAAICSGAMPGAGASGGSGGPGGCGGLPGQGGGAGGASIALASVEGKVTLKDCVLKAGNGGKGGAGGDLQPGGLGGLGGVGGTGVGGSKAACAGGQGGQGGNGGPGGGGLGGPSVAIAYRGEVVKQEGQTMLQPGTPGAGGPGGSSNVSENAGAEGLAAAEQELP